MAAVELNVTSIGRINSISDTSLNNTYAVVYNSATGTPMGFEMDIIVDMDASLVVAHAGITAAELAISNEVTARSGADTTLQGNINAEANTRAEADQTEAGVRSNADNALDEKIKNVTTGHDHDGVDSRVIDHDNLANKGTNTHAQIDSHIASTANPHSVTKAQVGLSNADNTSDANKPISTAQAAVNAAKADLVGGKVPSEQLPAYVDDVLEYDNLAAFPVSGEAGKIYVAKDTNLTYRWSGSAYVEISKSLALGETSATAYRGDRGKEAYDHTLRTDNPHGTTKSHVGLGNVDNTSDANKPISTAQQTVIEANELTEAEAIVKLFKEVDGIKTLLAKMVTGEAWIDKLLVMSELNLFGSTNIIIKATTAPIPDFIGQFFINTTSAPYVGYIAIGTASVSDWKQITN